MKFLTEGIIGGFTGLSHNSLTHLLALLDKLQNKEKLLSQKKTSLKIHKPKNIFINQS